ncbi:MAG: DUF2855 family protein [Pseudomonadota bacterium]
MSVRMEIKLDDLSSYRFSDEPVGDLNAGQIRVRVETFALTANNVTYGVVGDRIGYWKFFPASDGYGIIPVWGVGIVEQSACEEIEEGERLYGYFPMGSHLIMEPVKVKPNRFSDGTAHRQELPPVYNSYVRLSNEGGYDAGFDAARSLLQPLYFTSFCLKDFFLDNNWFGAGQLVVLSASSKTAIGLGYACADDSDLPPTLGLTSARNLEWVKSLNLYNDVRTYDDVDDLDASVPTAIVDMSGNGALLARLHRHLGDNMVYTSNVGVTHWEELGPREGFIRERSAMFFAPGHIQKRNAEWGPGVFEQKALDYFRDAARKSMGWMKFQHGSTREELADTYMKFIKGDVAPEVGYTFSL